VKITIRVRRRQVFDPLYCGIDRGFQRGQSRPAKIEDIAAKNKRSCAGRCVFNFCVMPFRVRTAAKLVQIRDEVVLGGQFRTLVARRISMPGRA
jgi:hypothetical protein